MRCHSTPNRAPTGLVNLYGDKVGFGEGVGQIRGMVVMEIPFDELESEAISHYVIILATLIFVFVLFYIILVALVKKDEKLQASNKKLELLSNTDKLTGLANRHYFDNHLAKQWSLMKRLHKPISLIMCDIDYFKQYNDSFGHQKGDDCLIEIANSFKKVIKRDTDIVSRYGGEEFAIVLSDTNIDNAVVIAKEILQAVRFLKIAHERPDEKNIVTVSLGLYTITPSSKNSIEMLIKSADEMLYLAKSNGKDRLEYK